MAQASKDYDVLIHTGGDSEGFATSVTYKFSQNGDLLDAEEDAIGTWSINEDYYVTIKIGLNTYEGVIIPQWNNDLQRAGLSITAYSRNGLSLWANEHFR